MDILDGRRHEKAPQFFLDRAVYFLNGRWRRGKGWGWLRAPGVAENFTPEAQKRGDAAFLKSFRALVDQWIDSGKDQEGIESPLARNVKAVPPGYTEPLFDVLTAWFEENPPYPVLTRSGKIAIRAHPTHYWKPHGSDKNLWAEEYANQCATFQLVELLDTPGAQRLARCNNPECGRYYLRSRLRKNEIKRGTYCANCLGTGSKVRTQATRDGRKRQLIEMAADVWRNRRAALRPPEQSAWIATQINRRLPKQGFPPITGRWVSQNREAIELEVERRNHAKG